MLDPAEVLHECGVCGNGILPPQPVASHLILAAPPNVVRPDHLGHGAGDKLRDDPVASSIPPVRRAKVLVAPPVDIMIFASGHVVKVPGGH